ncbi:MAG: hypothetical protein ACRDYU_05080, partial [Actinomycetes bacterium]
VTVVTGTRDTVVTPTAGRALYGRLRAAGHPTRYVEVPAADHFSLLQTRQAREAIRAATRP